MGAAVARKPPKPSAYTLEGKKFAAFHIRFYRDQARNLTDCELRVLGVIREEEVEARLDGEEWSRPLTEGEISEYVNQTERHVKRALSALYPPQPDDAKLKVAPRRLGLVEFNRVGRTNCYRIRQEKLSELPPREARTVTHKENRESAASLPAALTCPLGQNCPVEELTERQDGVLVNITGKPQKTEGHAKKQGTSVSPIDGGKAGGKQGEKGTSMSPIAPPPVASNDTAHRREVLRAGLEARLIARLAKGPSPHEVERIETALEGACLDQFWAAAEARIRSHGRKILGYSYFIPLAQDCARSRHAWDTAHGNGKARVREPEPPLDPEESRRRKLDWLGNEMELAHWDGHVQQFAARARLKIASDENPDLYAEAEKRWRERR